ncbi:MAG: DUF4912 domain-containing protein [Alkalispirochaeta sp.]
MIRKRLEELSLEALLLVASQNGLDLEPDLHRDDVIDELADLIAENREERESANSVTVKIQQKKYALLRDDEAPLSQDKLDAVELPSHYEINRITLMLRDPRWAFTYWDVSSGKIREYQESARFDGLYLRVLELEGHTEELRIRDSFEIPVQLSDSSWYIYLPRRQASYRIQLVARNNHRRELLAVSNEVYAPNDRLPDSSEALDPHRMALYELCGLEYLESPPFDEEISDHGQEVS